MISNPFSRTNARTRLHDRLLPRFLPDRRNAVDTRTLGDLDHALRWLLLERGVNVLGLNGGDGTLHAGVNCLIALAEEVKAKTGETLPLPKLLFLNGGTLNIVSRATGTKGNPARTVRAFVKHTLGQKLGSLSTREFGLLKVHPAGQPARYGFVFGSEVVANALEMYTLFGEGYVGLTRFLLELVGGYALNTRLWQEHAWKLDSPKTGAAVDSLAFPRYCCAVAATIDLSILKGLVSAFKVPPDSEGFFAKVLIEQDPGKIIRLIPGLMASRPHSAVQDVPQAQSLTVMGGFTLDGEVFLDRTPEGARREVKVTRAPFKLQAVRL